jgi:putative transcriptional regulator
MVCHHPDDATLLDYATGNLNGALSLIVATHMALCPRCRDVVAACERLGGVMLDAAETIAEPRLDFDELMSHIEAQRLDRPEPVVVPAPPQLAAMPRPLRDRLIGLGERLPWQRQGTIEAVHLACDDPGHRVRLLRIPGGQGVPRHTHRGIELTLVLEGAFSDATGHFGRGDIECADESLDHRPVADHGPACICLAVTSAPLRLTGRLGRLINPFLDI